MKKLLFTLLFAALFFLKITAQPDLLEADEPTTNYVTNAFKGVRVINGHSIEMLAPGTMDFRILHRFNLVNQGFYDAFGIDGATMRMGFDFGITKNLTLGIGRSTQKKEVDAFAKYRLLWQSTGVKTMPVSLVVIGGVTRNGLRDEFLSAKQSRRIAYYAEILIGRKFSERFSLQVAPMIIHRNVVEDVVQKNDIYAATFGGRFKFTKRIAFVWDYAHAFNRFPTDAKLDPLSIGIDIETGGHVFQLHFSNAIGMNERAFVTDENTDWLKGEFRFGFNLSRVFQIKKKKI